MASRPWSERSLGVRVSAVLVERPPLPVHGLGQQGIVAEPLGAPDHGLDILQRASVLAGVDRRRDRRQALAQLLHLLGHGRILGRGHALIMLHEPVQIVTAGQAG